ncbi:MAG: hypothetical protein B7X90_10005 [Novosphingobium sp. 17-62-19]|uniref:type II toxin-antitoxin system ParD family antitoxin n=1 Tax=Novosphingobium sp. 17-62-19 TaxID=1970406 RepID=UPI000BCAED27|nr:MAG: hypothetical protein B7Y74_06065 [Novosphingobium sp. 35-62-5]OZA19029.1 MAG: hypothetical protein B7X90_10005 [Novosphingobium sp. 17-62-19]
MTDKDAQCREEHAAKVRTLERALIEGEQSGEPQPFDFDEFLARKNREWNSERRSR